MEEIKLLLPIIIIILVLLIVSAFFSGSETALIALSRIRLRHLVNKGVKNAKVIQRLVADLDKLITTILIGNNLVNVAISVLGGLVFITIFGQRLGVVLATLFIAFMMLIFGEITPKIFSAQRTERVALVVAKPISIIVRLLSPIAKILMKLGNLIIRIFGGEPRRKSPLITEEEIRLMIEVGKEEGALSDEERRMLHRIFEFGDTKVGEVMIPKEDIVSINVEADEDELLSLIIEEGHSRIPVFKADKDNIIGIIFAKDLLHLWKNKELVIIKDIIHSPLAVPKSKRVNELLRDFQRMKVHMAIVVDEEKRLLGLVTLEDLIEEIVGEIHDEYELEASKG